jgi:serine/threonine protein phosphatase 1
MQKHLHLEHNSKGHDYIVGDIHGMFFELQNLLNYVKFNEHNDRLFSVGDIIDRGPYSLKCLELINKPWFFITKGNHEDMMIQSLIHHDNSYMDCWLNNGGHWINDINSNSQKQLIADLTIKLNSLPLIISVGNDINRFNICHADLTQYNHYHDIIPISNYSIDNWQFNDDDEYNMLWSRTIFNEYDLFKSNKLKYHSYDLSLTYVGHTPHFNHIPIQIEKHIYIDTGASMMNHHNYKYKSNSRLTIVSPTKQQFFTLDYQDNIQSFNINNIINYNT